MLGGAIYKGPDHPMQGAVPIDLRHPYLTRQLIAYIGNKRRLLPLLHEAVVASCGGDGRGLDFLDLFAGSGAVSRLARLMGFRVTANDWEEFSRIINTAHLGCLPGETGRLFAAHGSLERLLALLDALDGPPEGGEYLARWYAPADDDPARADYRRERLFYTRRNALAIDRARGEIERLFPAEPGCPEQEKRRALLIAPLLYEAATHTNTSGVFKACHKGFGGHGGDSLGRILAPVVLEPPVLLDAPAATVLAEDANALVRSLAAAGTSFDVAYLDPPYAPHQYGSNYHLLNSIARWDRPPAPLELDGRGELRSKAGIRPDWRRTWSAYCSRRTAEAALEEIILAVPARFILVSYSNQGIVPLERVVALCRARGAVNLVGREYTTYRGGRQSSGRVHRNVELVVVVDASRRSGIADRRAAEVALERRRIGALAARRFSRGRLEVAAIGRTGDGRYRLRAGGAEAALALTGDGRLEAPDLDGLGPAALAGLRAALEGCLCRDAEEELAELERASRAGAAAPALLRAEIARTLRRLANRRWRKSFEAWLPRLRALAADPALALSGLAGDLDALEEAAARRLAG